MRRDIGYFFQRDVITVYNAYLAAANNPQFRRDCKEEPFHTLSFGLNFSMKYNMNGGACIVHFMPFNGGTAVNIRFAVAQGFGARYERYADDLTSAVTAILGIAPQKMNFDMEPFLQKENRIYAESQTPVAPPPPPVQTVPPVQADAAKPDSFCIHCGKKLIEDAPFCPNCGNKVQTEPKAKFCINCGHKAEPEANFCINCGHKF